MAVFNETVTGYAAVEVYGGLAACVQYLGTQFSPAATKFLGLTQDDQRRSLIGATRFFEEQIWQGVANPAGNSPTVLSWPRSNVVDRDGNPLSNTVVPVAIVNGCFEMAALIAANPQVVTNPNPDQNVAAAGAGSDRVTFWRPPASRNPTGIPDVVERLVGQYLGAVDNVAYGDSYGVSNDGDADEDDTSVFNDDNAYTVRRSQ